MRSVSEKWFDEDVLIIDNEHVVILTKRLFTWFKSSK